MSNKEAVRKLLGLIGNYRKAIVFIVLCLVVSTVLNLFIPLLSKNIMDYGFIGGDKKLLIGLVILSSLVYVVNSFLDLIKERKRVDISADLEYFLSEQSFTHLMKLKADYFKKTNYAEILNTINTDIANITSIADAGMFFVVTQVFSIAGGVIGLFVINYKLTLLVLLFIPFKYWAMRYFAKKRKAYMDSFIKENQQYAGWFGDTAGGIQEIKLYGLLSFKQKEFKQKQKAVIHKKKKMNMIGEWNFAADTLLVQLLVMMLYIVGADLVFDLQLSVGSVFAFITYSSYVTSPISSILNIGYLLSGILPSTKRFYEFMDLEEEIEASEAEKYPEYGDLELKNVSFSYESGREILKQVNLKFPKGSKTVLIGSNGSGKSTIIGLLTRMYEAEHGTVLLYNRNVLEFSLGEYRSMISVVSQQIYLFNDSIRNNICLYKEVEEEKILEAVQECGLKEFIDEVSLDYKAGHNGALLSGGQKQKIAMARTLIHDRPIIILDEATSNADAGSEIQINSLLYTRLKDKTVIIVSHKQDILKEVDNIAFINEGNASVGNYQELYQKNSEFRKMIKEKDSFIYGNNQPF